MDDEKTQELHRMVMREYGALAPTIASLRRVPVEVAREALHTAVTKILAKLAERPPDGRAINWRPYIVQAAVNELNQEDRKRRNLTLVGGESGARALAYACAPGLTPATALEEYEFALRAWREVEHLSESQREVITRRCRYGDPFSQIALAMGIAPSTARVHFHDGIVELRKRLGIEADDLVHKKGVWKQSA